MLGGVVRILVTNCWKKQVDVRLLAEGFRVTKGKDV